MTPEREAHFRDDSNGSYTKYERAEIWAFVDEVRRTSIKALEMGLELREERDTWRNQHHALNVDLMAAQTEVDRLKHIDTLQCCCGDCYPIGSPHPGWPRNDS